MSLPRSRIQPERSHLGQTRCPFVSVDGLRRLKKDLLDNMTTLSVLEKCKYSSDRCVGRILDPKTGWYGPFMSLTTFKDGIEDHRYVRRVRRMQVLASRDHKKDKGFVGDTWVHSRTLVEHHLMDVEVICVCTRGCIMLKYLVVVEEDKNVGS